MLDLESSREWIGSNAAYVYFNGESLQSLDNCFFGNKLGRAYSARLGLMPFTIVTSDTT